MHQGRLEWKTWGITQPIIVESIDIVRIDGEHLVASGIKIVPVLLRVVGMKELVIYRFFVNTGGVIHKKCVAELDFRVGIAIRGVVQSFVIGLLLGIDGGGAGAAGFWADWPAGTSGVRGDGGGAL